MATIKTHAEDTIRILGGEHLLVHEWLDFYAKRWNPHIYSEYHRQFRHNAEGVKFIKDKWGFYSQQAAKVHIIRDYEMYLPNPVPLMDVMREDQIDEIYNKALKFCDPLRKDWKEWINENC